MSHRTADSTEENEESRQNMRNVTLYPMRVALMDDDRHDVRTIDVYEAGRRVNADNLPEGWHRYAVRANAGDGHNDTFENRVMVDHLNDYISREDVSELLDEHGGMYFDFTTDHTGREPIEMPESIYRR
jgi:hypothetical protein